MLYNIILTIGILCASKSKMKNHPMIKRDIRYGYTFDIYNFDLISKNGWQCCGHCYVLVDFEIAHVSPYYRRRAGEHSTTIEVSYQS